MKIISVIANKILQQFTKQGTVRALEVLPVAGSHTDEETTNGLLSTAEDGHERSESLSQIASTEYSDIE